MINPHRLIIGSWVLAPMPDNSYRWGQVTAIDQEDICIDGLAEGDHIQYNHRQIMPILITGTILEKFGFTLGEGSVWSHERHPIEIKRHGPEEWTFPQWSLLGATYLHELQFIFCFLTGEQLSTDVWDD